jgi:uncharacterized membrane protein
MAILGVVRCLLGDLPITRTEAFVPLLDQASLPIWIVAGLLIAARQVFARYAHRLTRDEIRMGMVSGLAAVMLIFLILSLDTFQYCKVVLDPQGTKDLLPHAVLSVVWSVYAGILLILGFWKGVSELRWAALVLLGGTLGKVLLVDLSWLSGLYRILALLLIAMVLGGATWAYQRREMMRPEMER